MKNLVILGSTGSIGTNTLAVVAHHADKFKVFALTAHRNIDKLYQQCLVFKPDYAVIVDTSLAKILQQRLAKTLPEITVLAGVEGLAEVAALKKVDIVMSAIVGGAGLLPTLAAAKAGKRLLLANKEALVMAGQLLIDTVQQSHAEILPVDSEHNAIFQCMPNGYSVGGNETTTIENIVLTASGGPFWQTPTSQLHSITPVQACKHPNWQMGKKISVDSATMMNKGLEVIEARWLFGLPLDKINVLLHPQSVIHSMVQYVDGSTLAQLGEPDMCTPIASALAWPQRIKTSVKKLNLADIAELSFYPVPQDKFPCLDLAYQAMRTGNAATIVLNAANEVAVQAFLDKKIAFTHIAEIVEKTLVKTPLGAVNDIAGILALDNEARRYAQNNLPFLSLA